MDKIAARIAAHVANVRFEVLPENAVRCAKRAVLDTVGCMLAGSGVKSVGLLIDLCKGWQGAREACVPAFGIKVPAPQAAWCNGMMARALEIDDCVDFIPAHPSASAVPALLALADAQGNLSGRDMIAALAVAQDVMIRLGLAVRIDAMISGRYNLFKIFAPAAAVARALRLDAEATHNALGIAYSYAGGEGQCAIEGVASLPLQQGITAQNGMLAALLAQKGMTGSRDFLFGRMGYFNAFEPDSLSERILDRLGRHFYGADISIKPYAACRACHEGIELAQRVYRQCENGASVRRATLIVAPTIKSFVGKYIEDATEPNSPTAAQFSLPFAVATTLVRGDFFLRELQPDVIADHDIRALARKIEVIGDRSLTSESVLGRARLEIQTKTGEVLVEETESPPGSPLNPLDFEACVGKVRKCAQFSICPPSEAALEKFEAGVSKLETMDDTSGLMSAF